MKIFVASIVIGLLALLAGNKADQEFDRLSREAINIPPADSPVPRFPSGEKQRVVDGDDIPVNPFARPDNKKRPVFKDLESQSQLESARFWEQIAPHAYKLAWMVPLAGLAFMMVRRMIPREEATEQVPEPVVEPDAETDKVAITGQRDSGSELPKEGV